MGELSRLRTIINEGGIEGDKIHIHKLSASGMTVQRLRMDIIAQNIANMEWQPGQPTGVLTVAGASDRAGKT